MKVWVWALCLFLSFCFNASAQTTVLSLNDSDSLILGDTSSLSNQQDLSVELWLKPDQGIDNGYIVSALGKQSGDVFGWALTTGRDNSFEFIISLENSEGFTTVNSRAGLEGRRCPSYVAGRWYHIAATYQASTGLLKLFQDGIQCRSNAEGNGNIRYAEKGMIMLGGNIEQTSRSPFAGSLSELRIWKSIKTKSQLRQSMSVRIDSSESLLAHWPLDDDGEQIRETTGRFDEVAADIETPWAKAHLPLEMYVPPQPSCQADKCGWYTKGTRIMQPDGTPFKIKAINWFGFQSSTNLVHGLWEVDVLTQLRKIKALGFNTIRLPFSNSTLKTDAKVDTYIEPLPGNSLFQVQMPALDALDTFINTAGAFGLFIILDRHNLTAGEDNPELWYSDEVTEQQWIDDWQMLAERYKDNPFVIGADVHNEPNGIATWGTGQVLTDWRMAAEKAGNAILTTNPNWLIFVEGIDWSDDFFESLSVTDGGVIEHPIRLHTNNKVVYSPHEYGPNYSGHRHRWFVKGMSYEDAKQVWDSTWGYILDNEIAPVFVGEFGGRFVDQTSTELLDNYPNREGEQPMTQGDAAVWFSYIVRYLDERNVDFGYWGWTPNSINTGGLLNDNWSVIRDKVVAINPVMDVPLTLQAQNDHYEIPELYPVQLNVLGNDASSFDEMTIINATQPGKGSLAIDGNILRYTSFADACGQDGFEYQVTDGLLTQSVVVTITVFFHDDADADCVRNGDDRWPTDPRWAYDNDVDNLPDNWEIEFFGTLDAVTGLLDSDGDGISNIQEWSDGTDPTNNRSGGTEADVDGDGMTDNWEVLTFGTILRDGTGDYDHDGFSDLKEFSLGLDPLINPAIMIPIYELLLNKDNQ